MAKRTGEEAVPAATAVKRLVWNAVAPWLPRVVGDACDVYLFGGAPGMDAAHVDADDGVHCTSLKARASAFHVECKMRTNNTESFERLGEEVLRALAAAARRPIGVRCCMCSCKSGDQDYLTLFVRFDAPVQANGAWVGNVLAAALRERLARKALTYVDVSPVHTRCDIVHSHVAYVQGVWGGKRRLSPVPSTDTSPVMAIESRWLPGAESCVHEWVDAPDDPEQWTAPVLVLGLSTLRSEAAEKKKKQEHPSPDGEGGSNKQLDAVLAKLPPAAATAVRRRRDEAAILSAADGVAKTKAQAWVDAVARLPLGQHAPPMLDDKTEGGGAAAALAKAAAALDGVVHGMADAKGAVLQIVGQLLRQPDAPVRAMAFVGSPGCGKTTLAVQGMGAALGGRPVRVICLGGAKDSNVLLGHDYTYLGSRPGRIVDALSEAGVMDPVLVFTELDKVSDTAQGREIVHVLMKLVDPTQNSAFTETYLSGVPLDLSRAIIVFTLNDASLVDPILLDRMHVVHVPDISIAEKRRIVRERLLPRTARAFGLMAADGTGGPEVSDDDLDRLLAACDAGGGLRGIEKALERALLHANVRALRAGGSGTASAPIRLDATDIAAAVPKAPAGSASFMTMYS